MYFTELLQSHKYMKHIKFVNLLELIKEHSYSELIWHLAKPESMSRNDNYLHLAYIDDVIFVRKYYYTANQLELSSLH